MYKSQLSFTGYSMSQHLNKDTKRRGRPEMPSAQRDHMKQRISDVAGALFRGDGYSNVSMRRIAKQMGCTPMTLYGYYDGKIDILRSLWGGVFENLFDTLAECVSEKDPQTYLLNLCAAYVQYWLDHPDYYRLVFMAEGVMQPDVSLFLDNPNIMARYDLFTVAIQNLRGETSEAIMKSKVDFLISALHGIAHNKITISGYEWSTPKIQIRYALAGIS